MPCLSVDLLPSEPLVSTHQVVRLITTILRNPSVNAFNTFALAVMHRFCQACRELTGTCAKHFVSPTASQVARVAQVSPIMAVVHRQ